jgi:hypothetical protein
MKNKRFEGGSRVSERLNNVNYRDMILTAVQELVERKGSNEFELGEAVEYILSKFPNLNTSTIRTHITSRCCINATSHHAVTYNDYERISRGFYRLYDPRISDGKKLYFVDVNTKNNVLLALDLKYLKDEGKEEVQFFDTNRGRGFEGEILVQEKEGFIFRTKHERTNQQKINNSRQCTSSNV